jgi:hypothetical protein
MTEREREFLRWVRAAVAEIDRATGPDGAKGIKLNGKPISQLDAMRHQAKHLYDEVAGHLDPSQRKKLTP